jgi:RHS repeat-associated protein
MRTPTALTWLAGDHQSTQQIAINSADLTVQHRRQTPFGGSRGPEVVFPGEKGFVGGTNDKSAGLTHIGASHYDSSIGRFISVDPVMNPTSPQQMQGYSYSNNSPVTFSDPTGLEPLVVDRGDDGKPMYCPLACRNYGYTGKMIGAHPDLDPEKARKAKWDPQTINAMGPGALKGKRDVGMLVCAEFASTFVGERAQAQRSAFDTVREDPEMLHFCLSVILSRRGCAPSHFGLPRRAAAMLMIIGMAGGSTDFRSCAPCAV